MPTLRLPSALALAALLAAGCTTTDPYTGETQIDAESTAALATLAVLGAAAYAASSDDEDDRHEYHRSYDGYRQPDRRDSYSPARGVICYDYKRACYRDGHYSAKWTEREFG